MKFFITFSPRTCYNQVAVKKKSCKQTLTYNQVNKLIFRRMKYQGFVLFQGQGGNNDQQKEKERQIEEMKHSILSQVLDQSARTRCKSSMFFYFLYSYSLMKGKSGITGCCQLRTDLEVAFKLNSEAVKLHCLKHGSSCLIGNSYYFVVVIYI